MWSAPLAGARSLSTTVAVGLVLAGLAGGPASPSVRAQTAQPMDEDFAERVREWTTRPEFLSPLVDHLPRVDGVPSPKEVLGHHAGAPRELTYYAELLEYYRTLADASPRVSTMSIGRTDEDREMVVVAIAGAETIRNLERYRGYLGQLVDPRGLSDAEALQIIGQAKPIYHFMAGLHSGETGPPEMLMELAYRLAVEDGPLFDQIRANVIVTVTPAAEPDGRDRYVDWRLPPLDRHHRRGRPDWRAAVLGEIHLSRQQPRHQLFPAEHAGRARLVPRLAPADHARPARVGAVPLHLQWSGAPEPDARPDRLRRAAVVRELRDGAADQVRHAGRLDPRLRRHVVARVSGVHGVEPQRADPLLRDVRQRRRDDDDAAPQDRGQHARAGADQPRVVSALAPVRRGRVVDAEQH